MSQAAPQEDSALIGTPNPAASMSQTHKGYKTPCECGKSMCLLPFPFFHCPKGHHTYKLRTRGWPVKCGRCGYDIEGWRARNAIPDIIPALP